MENILFQFSALRPAILSDAISPIILIEGKEIEGTNPKKDREPHARNIIELTHGWISSPDFKDTLTFDDLRSHLTEDPSKWSPDLLDGVIEELRFNVIDNFWMLVWIYTPGGWAYGPTGNSFSAEIPLINFLIYCEKLISAMVARELPSAVSTSTVSSWIYKHPLCITPGRIIKDNQWVPRKALAVPLRICDQFVVRDSIAGYESSEISDVKSFIQGEVTAYQNRHSVIDGCKISSPCSTTTGGPTDIATQQRCSMKQHTTMIANSLAGADRCIHIETHRGPMLLGLDPGYPSIIREARQRASEFAHDVLERGVERVREHSVDRIACRAHTEIEESCTRVRDNSDGTGSKIEIYRWVDSIWTATLNRRKERRLILEFLVPDPGRIYRSGVPIPPLDTVCRHICISNLLGGWWPDTSYRHDQNWPKPGGLANAPGRIIHFMEQAFEWSGIKYVAYPFYWENINEWNKMQSFQHYDPKVQEFMHSSAVRFYLPARLELTEAVLFFLATGIPLLSRFSPIPGGFATEYLAIASEVRASQITDEDEEFVSRFDYRLPTCLTILDPSESLQHP
ncbi:hypothetical protein [Nocardia araoensis]|uniref:hypothetical protein n=1 Tax=Nocardia araoensis TaxID=228600 RepID=UPI0002E3E4AE|nr:hypothetical protein [Nocardia araoensis]